MKPKIWHYFVFFSIIAIAELVCVFVFDETFFVIAGMFVWYAVDTIIAFIKNKKEKWIEFVFFWIYLVICIISIIYLSLK